MVRNGRAACRCQCPRLDDQRAAMSPQVSRADGNESRQAVGMCPSHLSIRAVRSRLLYRDQARVKWQVRNSRVVESLQSLDG